MLAIDFFKGEKTFKQTLSNCNSTIFYISIFTSVIFVFASPLLISLFDIPFWIVAILPLTCLLNYYTELLLLLFRYKDMHVSYLKTILIKTLLEVAVTLLFLLVLHWGWYSRVAGILIGFLVPVYFLLKVIPAKALLSKPDKMVIKATIRRGLPFVIAQFLIIAFISVDKFFIPKYFSKHDLGLYGIAFQISNLLTIFAVSLISVLQPIQYKLATDLTGSNKEKLMRLIYTFVSVQFIASVSLVLISPLIYRYFINVQYHESMAWIIYLVIAAFFSSCSAFFMNIVRQKGTGRQLIEVNLYPLLLLIFLFFILPRYFHILGVLYAYIIVNFLILVLTIRRSMKALNISNNLLLNQLKTSIGKLSND
jgi:O-antigen/teichoic acid export membrane protein